MPSGIDRLLATVSWVALDEDSLAHDEVAPYATHEGWMEMVPGVRLHVYRLNTGKAVIAEESVQRFFRWLGIDILP